MINRGECDDSIAEVSVAGFTIAKAIMNLEMEGLRALSTINENKFPRYANKYYENIPNYQGPNSETGNNGNANILQP